MKAGVGHTRESRGTRKNKKVRVMARPAVTGKGVEVVVAVEAGAGSGH